MKTNHPISWLLGLPRPIKRAIAVTVDSLLCVATVWLAFGLRLDQWQMLSDRQWLPVAVSLTLALPLFITSGLYRAIFRYAGWHAMATVIRVMLIYSVLFAAVFTFFSVSGIPRTVGLIQPALLLIAVAFSRLATSYWLSGAYHGRRSRQALPRVLIYGAGASGRQLAGALSTSREMVIVGFLDDDRTLAGNTINGLRVYDSNKLESTFRRLRITDVLLAIPSASRERRNSIIAAIQPFAVRVRTVPSFVGLTYDKIQEADLRDLDIDDLLGRDPVTPNGILMNKNIHSKVVVVTGAGGSIGSELCRQIISAAPDALLLIEATEFALYSIHQELTSSAHHAKVRIVPLLASVQDQHRMEQIFMAWRPHTVYHAAAYKHVPLVEHNPSEGIKNNVFGTLSTAQAAIASGVSDFVLISTDKAVRPTNVMGASKRLAEIVLQGLASGQAELRGKTRFSMVRFGNVLGSSGSVVPLFRKQIENGGPITLTHESITRYFMTIPEAAQLVIQAGAMANGGDVFVLDMGEPVKISDLAHRMVELSGRTVKTADNPEGDIEIKITGLRPGEKLYEELLIGDNPEPTQHPRIMKAHEDFLGWTEIVALLNKIEQALAESDVAAIRELLGSAVSGYRQSADIVDWIYLRKSMEVHDLADGTSE